MHDILFDKVNLTLTDISQITFRFVAIIPKLHHRRNGFPSAGIR